MKKTLFTFVIVLGFAFLVSLSASAQSSVTNEQGGDTLRGASTTPGGNRPGILRPGDKFKADMEKRQDVLKNRIEDLKERIDIKNQKKEDIKDMRDDAKNRFASTTIVGERRNIKEELRNDVLKTRQNAIVKQLNISISNLEQIKSRLGSRIEKASKDGRDMTNARLAMAQVDIKMKEAKDAVVAIQTFVPPTVNATTTPNLTKPQELVKNAQNSIKAVRDSLNKVVVAIAKSMGLKLGEPAPKPQDNNASTTGVTN